MSANASINLVYQINQQSEADNGFFTVSKAVDLFDISYNFKLPGHFANEIAQQIVTEMDTDTSNQFATGYSHEKYLNFYAKLYKLEEAMNDFDFTNSEDSAVSQSVQYLAFLRRLINQIVFGIKASESSHNSQQSQQQSPQTSLFVSQGDLPDIDEDGNWINRCIICRVDMGSSNPRQYCRKTYCPEMNQDM